MVNKDFHQNVAAKLTIAHCDQRFEISHFLLPDRIDGLICNF